MIVLSPGKVVLLGEYAVLDGAPAVVVAVDRGVRCEVTPADLARTGSAASSAPGGLVRIELPPGLSDDRFVRAALEAVGAPPGVYRFSDWNPVDSAVKVGLGGSAAATVAAVLAGAPELPVGERYRIARDVHHAVQGSGSGIDIAASTYGGVLSFTRARAADFARGPEAPSPEGTGRMAGPEQPSPRPSPRGTGEEDAGEDQIVALPPVSPSVVFSGSSAATGPRVRQYLAWPGRDGFVAESAALVSAFPADPVGALRSARDLLRSMASQAGLAYWTDEIDLLARLADQHGGAAKPSGAGGGDVVVALFPDADARAAYERAAARAGFLVIAVTPCGGARIAQRA